MVVFVFRFQDLIAFLELLPLFPFPEVTPRFFALEIDPRFNVPLLTPVLTKSIFCSVLLLHFGQNLFVSFGSFILV